MSEFLISNDLITQCNEISAKSHEEDFEKLAILLDRKSLSISDLVSKASNYNVAIQSWGTGTGGTRFARYPGKGEPRDIFDKVDDCSVINQLSACTPSISYIFHGTDQRTPINSKTMPKIEVCVLML